jgi:3-oxoadipate enol-lactonase
MNARSKETQRPALVLLHAFPLSSAMWENERATFGSSFIVVTPDLPGFGKSERLSQPSILAMAQWVANELERQGIEGPVVLAGLSMGGYVAFEFLRHFPERVAGLGLFSTRAVPDTPEGRKARLATIEKIEEHGLNWLARTILPKLVGKTTLHTRPELIRKITNWILANRPQAVQDALLAMANRRDSTDLLRTIRCPTLVVGGDEDTFLSVSETQALAEQIPKAQFAVIHGAGHLVNLEQPKMFTEILGTFLGSLG